MQQCAALSTHVHYSIHRMYCFICPPTDVISDLFFARSNVKVESCFEEKKFRKKQGIYHEVPLFELKEKYQSEEGKKFLEKLVSSQTGRNHHNSKTIPP